MRNACSANTRDVTPTPPVPNATLALDGAAMERALRRIAHEIVEEHPTLEDIALIGIPSRGVEVCRRLAAYAREIQDVPVYSGIIDVSMHRDDLHTKRRIRTVQPTCLPPDLEKKTLVLADDVLYSGRTIRAALDAVASFGRPARIQLAVLIDRGHRELPIQPDFVGREITTDYSQRVFVRFESVDGVPDSVWTEKM